MIWILSHLLAGVLAIAALAGLGWGVGLALPVPRIAGRACLEPTERCLLSVALGSAIAMAVLFLLACIGALFATPIAALALCGLLLAGFWGYQLARRRGDDAPPSGGERSGTLGRPADVLLALGLLALLLALLIHAFRPDVTTDADVYHLTLPRLFLEHHGFFRVPFNVYSNWPLGTELLFSACMALGDFVVAKTLHFGLGVLALVGAAVLAGRGRSRGLVAASLVLLHPVVLFPIRAAYVDLANAFLLTVTALLVLRALELGRSTPEEEREARDATRRLLALAGLCAAACLSVKLNGFLGPLCCLLVLIAAQRRRGTRWREVATQTAIFVVPIAVAGLAWATKAWWATGNPVYPFFYHWLGGPEWSETLTAQWSAWQRGIGMGRGPLDYLLLPLRVLFLGEHGYRSFDGRLEPLLALFLSFALWGARRDPRTGRLLAICGLYFLLWAVSSQQMRFLIPILPLLAAACSRGTLHAVARIPGVWRPAAGLLLSGVLVATLALSSRAYWQQVPTIVSSYLRYGSELEQLVIEPVYRYVDTLPPNAKLLLLNTNRGFRIHRPFVADSFFEASQIVDAFADARTETQARERLEQLGITHILIEQRPLGVPYPDALVELLVDPRQTERIYTSPDQRFRMLRLR